MNDHEFFIFLFCEVCHDRIPSFFAPPQDKNGELQKAAQQEAATLSKSFVSTLPGADPSKPLSGKQKKKLKLMQKLAAEGKEFQHKVGGPHNQKMWANMMSKNENWSSVEALTKLCDTHMTAFDMRNTGQVIVRATHLFEKKENQEAMKKLILRAAVKLSQFESTNFEISAITLAIWGLGKTGVSSECPNIFRKLIANFKQCLTWTKEIEARVWSSISFGMVHADIYDYSLFSLIASTALDTKFKGWKTQEFSTIMWALSKVDMLPPHLVDAVSAHVLPALDFKDSESYQWKNDQFKWHSRELSTLCWALARSSSDAKGGNQSHALKKGKSTVEKFLLEVAQKLRSAYNDDLPNWASLDVSQLMWACGEADVRDHELFRVCCEKLVPSCDRLSGTEIGSIIFGLGKLRFHHTDLMEGLCTFAPRLTKKVDVSSLMNVMFGATRLNAGKNKDFMPWVEHTLDLLESTKKVVTFYVTTLCWCLAVLLADGWNVQDQTKNVGIAGDSIILTRCVRLLKNIWSNPPPHMTAKNLNQIYQLHIVLTAMNAPGSDQLPTPESNKLVKSAVEAVGQGENGLSRAELLANTSNFQKRIEATLLALQIDFEQEYFVAHTFVDFILPNSNLVIEADGPSHFIDDITKPNPIFWDIKLDHNGQAKMSDDEAKQLWDSGVVVGNATSTMKRKLIENAGYQVLNIPWWDWRTDLETNKALMQGWLDEFKSGKRKREASSSPSKRLKVS